MTYTDVFGSATLPPAEYGYASFTLTTNATFVWPYNTDGSSYPVAKVMDITCDAGNEVALPDCTEVSTGEDFLIRNVGANVLMVKDAAGVQVASVAVGAASYFYLTDNTSAAGVFGVIGFGVGTSTADASSLVGYGIKAVGASLNQAHPVQPTNTGITLSADHRAKLVVFTGGVAAFALDSAATLGDDYFTMFRNDGTGTATIDPAASELIDGMASMQVQPGESLMLICTGTKWYSVGYGRSTLYQFTQLTKDVSAGGTITLLATEAANKLITFIGNPSAAVDVVVPAVVAVYYTQSAISTAQTITLKTSAGSGVGISQGTRIIALCDGTNVVSAQSAVANASVSLTDSSALVPSLFFATQTNTGLFKSGTQDVGVTVNGSTVGVFGSTGLQTTTIGPNSTQRHTLPAVLSDTVTLNTATQTLTNKTISVDNNTISGLAVSSFALTNASGNLDGLAAAKAVPAGVVVGTTDAQTLTNKTISVGSNTVSGVAASSFVLSDASGNINGSAAQKVIPTGVVVGTTDTQTLTNKTLTAPAINSPTGITKGDVGLGNVDNTSDANKPVSTATQEALDTLQNSLLSSSGSTLVGYLPAGTGAVPTDVQTKLREFVSVKDFGAVAGTDATEAINKAIDYVSSLGGGVVTGQSSEEYFALNVRIKSGVILRGLRLVTLPTSTENLACITFDSSGVTDAVVEDCIIDGNAANQIATVVQCVSVNGSRNSVRGCTLKNGKRSGIELKAGISHIRIKDNHISDMVRFGIYHEHHPLLVSKYVTISGNTIERMGATGVNLITGDDLGNHSAGVQFWSITNNFVKDTGLTEAAGAIGGYSKNNKHVLIAYNVMENINNHLHHVAGENISVIGNIGRNITNTGIVVRAWPNDIGTGGDLSKNIIVSNNQIDLVTSDDVSGYGVYVANSEGVTVSGNCISGTVKDGIYIAGEQLGRTIRTTDVTVGNNVISEADNAANISHASPESGINVENADQVALTGNSVRKTYDSGIRVAGSTDVTISGNSSCDSKASNGIIVLQTATDGSTATAKVAINGNVCSGNFNFGILFSGVVDRAVVVGNICRNNLTGQIVVGSPTSTILANNAGYRTKNRGTNSVANGGTISHFMDAAPTSYRVTPTVANRVAAVTAVSGSTITVALHDNAGAAITVAEPVNWEVSAELM